MADTITQMADMIDPEVLAPMVHYSLEKALRFTPIAKTDDSLKGKPGDTLSMPKFTYIGDAQDIGEGQPIPLDKLGTKSASVKVKKAAKGTQITDEALLSGEGEPLKESTRQLGLAIANKIDDDLLTEAKKGKLKVTFAPTVSGVQDGLDVFSDEDDKQVVLVVSPATAAKIRMDAVKNHAGSDTIANALIKGTYFDVLGVQIIRSKKLKDTEALFIKADNTSPALKLIRRRDIQVETDRDITKKITIMTADQHYAAYLYDDTKIVVGTVQSETTDK